MNQKNKPANKSPLEDFKGVGPKSIQKFNKLGIYQPKDLLFHLPTRYEDRTRIQSISNLKPGDSALVKGVILQSKITSGRKRALIVNISDGSHFLSLRFFHFSTFIEKSFIENAEIYCFGEIRRGLNTLEMIHPEYQIAKTNNTLLSDHLTPNYPTTDGLPQKLLRSVIHQAINQLHSQKKQLVDLLPARITQQLGLPSLSEAIIQLHQPDKCTNTVELSHFQHPAQKRLIIEELLAHRLSLKHLHQNTENIEAPVLTRQDLSLQFIQNLPFQLTNAQSRVIDEIRADLSTPNRLACLVGRLH